MQPGVPIAEASKQLGVPMPTLRSWELRYGIPEISRASGTHRRYSAVELRALTLMRDEIARGKRAGIAAQSVRAMLGLSGPAAEFIARFLKASSQLDAPGVRAQLEVAHRTLGLGPCIDEVVMPAMQQIGEWWQTGRCDIEQERLSTEATRAWLDSLAAQAPPPSRDSPILLACGPTDLHTLGLEALGLLLRNRQWACRQLGARVPVSVLRTAAMASSAAGVVLVSHLSSGRSRALQSLQAVDELGIPLFYAGNAFSAPRSRARLPGHYLGDRLQGAVELVDRTLSP